MVIELTGILAHGGLNNLGRGEYLPGHHFIPRAWILVADASGARVFRKADGQVEFLGEVSPGDRAEPRLSNVSVGRVGSSASSSIRHKYEPHMGQSRGERTSFAAGLADWLDLLVRQDVFDRLVLFAPPSMLGDLRKQMSGRVAGRIIAQLDKDLMHLGARDLQQYLKDAFWPFDQ